MSRNTLLPFIVLMLLFAHRIPHWDSHYQKKKSMYPKFTCKSIRFLWLFHHNGLWFINVYIRLIYFIWLLVLATHDLINYQLNIDFIKSLTSLLFWVNRFIKKFKFSRKFGGEFVKQDKPIFNASKKEKQNSTWHFVDCLFIIYLF